jgi:hypothetical protein
VAAVVADEYLARVQNEVRVIVFQQQGREMAHRRTVSVTTKYHQTAMVSFCGVLRHSESACHRTNRSLKRTTKYHETP